MEKSAKKNRGPDPVFPADEDIDYEQALMRDALEAFEAHRGSNSDQVDARPERASSRVQEAPLPPPPVITLDDLTTNYPKVPIITQSKIQGKVVYYATIGLAFVPLLAALGYTVKGILKLITPPKGATGGAQATQWMSCGIEYDAPVQPGAESKRRVKRTAILNVVVIGTNVQRNLDAVAAKNPKESPDAARALHRRHIISMNDPNRIPIENAEEVMRMQRAGLAIIQQALLDAFKTTEKWDGFAENDDKFLAAVEAMTINDVKFEFEKEGYERAILASSSIFTFKNATAEELRAQHSALADLLAKSKDPYEISMLRGMSAHLHVPMEIPSPMTPGKTALSTGPALCFPQANLLANVPAHIDDNGFVVAGHAPDPSRVPSKLRQIGNAPVMLSLRLSLSLREGGKEPATHADTTCTGITFLAPPDMTVYRRHIPVAALDVNAMIARQRQAVAAAAKKYDDEASD